MTDLEYLEQSVVQHLDWVKRITGKDYAQWVRDWVRWAWDRRFAFVLNFQRGYIIMRPVRLDWIFDTSIDYFQTIQWCDFHGDAIWIDSVWAPGNYSAVLALLRSTRKTYVGWSHPDKLHVTKIAALSGNTPLKSQIEAALRENHVQPR
jgi:hypothetical protein